MLHLLLLAAQMPFSLSQPCPHLAELDECRIMGLDIRCDPECLDGPADVKVRGDIMDICERGPSVLPRCCLASLAPFRLCPPSEFSVMLEASNRCPPSPTLACHECDTEGQSSPPPPICALTHNEIDADGHPARNPRSLVVLLQVHEAEPLVVHDLPVR